MRSIRTGAGVASLLLTACAAGPGIGEAKSDLAQGQLLPDMEMTCEQITLALAVSPDVASRYVPAERTLVLDAAGNAQVLVPLKKCSSFQIAGSTEYGPLDFFVVWIVVQGPAETTPIPGAWVTQPTFYAEYAATYFDSFQFWNDMRKSGVDIRRAAQIVLGPPGSSGYVHEQGSVGFSWQEAWVTQPAPVPIGWNIVTYRDDDVTPSVERIACVFYDSVNAYVSLSVDHGSLLAPFGTSLEGGTLDANVHCSVTFAAAADPDRG